MCWKGRCCGGYCVFLDVCFVKDEGGYEVDDCYDWLLDEWYVV